MRHNRRYDIEAIPTLYKGVKYRSKLESRWAMFFDALKIKYTYETVAYQLGQVTYLPDFFLSNCPYDIVEIKPTYPTKTEKYKCRMLSTHADGVAILAGSPRLDDFQVVLFENGNEIDVDFGKLFGLKCLVKGLSPDLARNLTRLRCVLGKIDYNAFED